MALAPLASVSELATWLDVDEATLPARAAMALDIVSGIARKEARTSFPGGAPWDVKGVVLAAAKRALGNPDDLRQETVGAISVTYAAETIGVTLAEAERDLLRRYRPTTPVVNLVEPA